METTRVLRLTVVADILSGFLCGTSFVNQPTLDGFVKKVPDQYFPSNYLQ